MSQPETLTRVEVKGRGPIVVAQKGISQMLGTLAAACWDRGLVAVGEITIDQQEYQGEIYIKCWVLAKPLKVNLRPVVARLTRPEGFGQDAAPSPLEVVK